MGLLGQGAGPVVHIQVPALLLKKYLFLEDGDQHGGTQIKILTEHERCVGIRLSSGTLVNSSNPLGSLLVHRGSNLLNDKSSCAS